MAKVYLSAGHGGGDPGAVGNGLKEKDLNLSITLACRDVLEWHGVSVKMSRTTDKEVTWQQEVNECNNYDPSIAVNIHCNAGGGDGAEVFYHYGGGTGKTLASNILAEIVAIGQNSRGIKTRRTASGEDYYYFIREIACASTIVECCFMDTADIKILDTDAEQKAMGVAIAKGILKTLGIAYKEQSSNKVEDVSNKDSNKVSGKLYRCQCGAFRDKSNAENMVKKLKAAGFEAFIVEV